MSNRGHRFAGALFGRWGTFWSQANEKRLLEHTKVGVVSVERKTVVNMIFPNSWDRENSDYRTFSHAVQVVGA